VYCWRHAAPSRALTTLTPDKSEALIVGTSCHLSGNKCYQPWNKCYQASHLWLSLGSTCQYLSRWKEWFLHWFLVILDRRLTFEKHATVVAKSCNYHAQATRHVWRRNYQKTLACTCIYLRIDYCNALLYGTPTGTIQKLQRVQNNAARIVLQMPRRSHAKPLLNSLHWLPVDERIIYKMAMVTFEVQRTATPAYLSRHLQPRNCVRNLRSSDTPLLCQPSTKTDLARRGFRYSAPVVCNSLPRTVVESPSITVFKSKLKTHLFDLAHTKH